MLLRGQQVQPSKAARGQPKEDPCAEGIIGTIKECALGSWSLRLEFCPVSGITTRLSFDREPTLRFAR